MANPLIHGDRAVGDEGECFLQVEQVPLGTRILGEMRVAGVEAVGHVYWIRGRMLGSRVADRASRMAS